MIDAEKVIQMAAREIEAHKDDQVGLTMNIVQAVRLISLVQLSLRHAGLPEENVDFGRRFCDNLIELISQGSQELADFCRLGYDDTYDVPKEGGE
jgi:hypothetical protein